MCGAAADKIWPTALQQSIFTSKRHSKIITNIQYTKYTNWSYNCLSVSSIVHCTQKFSLLHFIQCSNIITNTWVLQCAMNWWQLGHQRAAGILQLCYNLRRPPPIAWSITDWNIVMGRMVSLYSSNHTSNIDGIAVSISLLCETCIFVFKNQNQFS